MREPLDVLKRAQAAGLVDQAREHEAALPVQRRLVQAATGSAHEGGRELRRRASARAGVSGNALEGSKVPGWQQNRDDGADVDVAQAVVRQAVTGTTATRSVHLDTNSLAPTRSNALECVELGAVRERLGKGLGAVTANLVVGQAVQRNPARGGGVNGS